MATALSTLRTLTRANHHLLNNTNTYSNTIVNTMINFVLNTICDSVFQYNPDYLFDNTTLTITANTQAVALPANFRSLRKIYFGTGSNLTPLTKRNRFEDLSVVDPGDPSYFWCPGPPNIYLCPIATETKTNYLKLYYVKGHTDLSGDSDNMVLPDDWKNIVAFGAAAMLLVKEDQAADGMLNLYYDMLDRKLNSISRPVTGDPGRSGY